MTKIKKVKTIKKITQKKKTSARVKKLNNKITAVEEGKKSLVKPNKKFNKTELLLFRERLIKMREQIAGKIKLLMTDNLTRSAEDNQQDFRSEEQGTDNFERDFALNQASFDQETIFEIDEALERIRLGLYGICESCEGGIEKARLQAMPFTRMCVKCQSTMEKGKRNLRKIENVSLFSNTDKSTAEGGAEEET
jgi:DnaK suppressor protein